MSVSKVHVTLENRILYLTSKYFFLFLDKVASPYYHTCSKIDSCFHQPLPSMMLLTLAGAGCIVTNQTVSSVISTELIQGILTVVHL